MLRNLLILGLLAFGLLLAGCDVTEDDPLPTFTPEQVGVVLPTSTPRSPPLRPSPHHFSNAGRRHDGSAQPATSIAGAGGVGQ
ncbi:MAG: hypothetical protein HC915_00400 [Anaerolineae bacterium]|nr:hypothetical protein [Anaerolineae bacterium]